MKKRKAVRRGRGFWVRLVANWQRSGMSYGKFAKAQGVSVHTLRYWVYKLREGGPELETTRVPAFVEVEGAVLPPRQASHACRLRLGQHLVLELSELPPASWIRELC